MELATLKGDSFRGSASVAGAGHSLLAPHLLTNGIWKSSKLSIVLGDFGHLHLQDYVGDLGFPSQSQKSSGWQQILLR